MTRLLALLACCAALAACGGGQNNRSSSQPARAAEINLQLGIDYLRKGNLQQAKEKIERALEQDSRNAKVHAAAGLLYDRLGEDRKAENHFDRALSLNGQDPEIRNNFAAVLCSNARYERGEKLALEAARDPLYKTPEVALLNAGNCSRGAGNLQRAEQHYRDALKRQSRFAPALLQMASLEFQQRNYMPARAFLERYMEVARVSAEGLWLGYRIEHELGNAPAAEGYARRLRHEFPTSMETKELIKAGRS